MKINAVGPGRTEIELSTQEVKMFGDHGPIGDAFAARLTRVIVRLPGRGEVVVVDTEGKALPGGVL